MFSRQYAGIQYSAVLLFLFFPLMVASHPVLLAHALKIFLSSLYDKSLKENNQALLDINLAEVHFPFPSKPFQFRV